MKSLSESFDQAAAPDLTMYTISGGVPVAVLEEKGKFLTSVGRLPSWATSSSDLVQLENAQLKGENISLKERLRKIEERLLILEASLPKEKVIVLRSITKLQARKEIRELFAKEKTLYYSDIADRLGLDLELVVQICTELEAEGVISQG